MVRTSAEDAIIDAETNTETKATSLLAMSSGAVVEGKSELLAESNAVSKVTEGVGVGIADNMDEEGNGVDWGKDDNRVLKEGADVETKLANGGEIVNTDPPSTEAAAVCADDPVSVAKGEELASVEKTSSEKLSREGGGARDIRKEDVESGIIRLDDKSTPLGNIDITEEVSVEEVLSKDWEGVWGTTETDEVSMIDGGWGDWSEEGEEGTVGDDGSGAGGSTDDGQS